MQAPDHQDHRALVSLWLRRLGEAAGLPLHLSADGVCGIGHDSGIDCAIEVPENGGCVYLRAPLLPWPPIHLGRITERLLTAQFLGLETEGAAFAIDPRDRELVVWRCTPIALLDEAAFEAFLLGFLQMAVRWRDELQRADFAPEVAADGTCATASHDTPEGTDSALMTRLA